MQGRQPLLYTKFIIYNYLLLFTILSRLTYAFEKIYLVAFRYDGWKDEKMTASFPLMKVTGLQQLTVNILDVHMGGTYR